MEMYTLSVPFSISRASLGELRLAPGFFSEVYLKLAELEPNIDPDYRVSIIFEKNGKEWGGKLQTLDTDKKTLFAAGDPRLSIGRTLGTYWGRWLYYVKRHHRREMKENLSETLQALGQPDCIKIRFRFLPTPQTIWERL